MLSPFAPTEVAPARRRLLTGLCVACLLPFIAPSIHAASKPDRIIISGASGQVGEFTIKELLRRGVKPRNLILTTRTPDDLAEYARMGATVRYADLYKPESLPAAFAGGTRMLLISVGAGPIPRPEAHKAGFDAAVKAGVKHIVYTSFTGADKGESPIAKEHQQSEVYLRTSGAKWTMLRNGFYSDVYVTAAIEMAKTGQTTVRPNEKKFPAVTRADCGAAAAAALLKPTLSENHVFEVTGPELVDRGDVARLVTAMTGKPIEVTEGKPDSRDPQGSAGPEMHSPQLISNDVKKLTGHKPMQLKTLLDANKERILAAARGA